MSQSVTFHSVHPLGDTDPAALPVKDIGPAVGYYTCVLGFDLVERQENRATLQRDSAVIGLERNDRDPEQASCYFAVSDVETLHRELTAKGIEPSALEVQEYGGKRFRVFFAKEPYGVCFCFGQPA
jgi:catechol 2,3-dioxygenase-like lactoylglutathione lyase family enzyme